MGNTIILIKRTGFYFYFILASMAMVTFGCAKSMQIHTLPANVTPQETAKIYIFRPSPFAYAIKEEIYENNVIVGQVGSGGYIAWDAKPGSVVLQGPWGFMKVLAQPGKTYYFKISPKVWGFGRSGFVCKSISEEEGKSLLSKLKPPKVKIVS